MSETDYECSFYCSFFLFCDGILFVISKRPLFWNLCQIWKTFFFTIAYSKYEIYFLFMFNSSRFFIGFFQHQSVSFYFILLHCGLVIVKFLFKVFKYVITYHLLTVHINQNFLQNGFHYTHFSIFRTTGTINIIYDSSPEAMLYPLEKYLKSSGGIQKPIKRCGKNWELKKAIALSLQKYILLIFRMNFWQTCSTNCKIFIIQ